MNRLFARRSALILAAIFILGLVLVFAGPRQSGPVLTVNGEEVSTGRFETDYRAAQLAYGRLAQTPPPLRGGGPYSAYRILAHPPGGTGGIGV
jgi:hypothetical protein